MPHRDGFTEQISAISLRVAGYVIGDYGEPSGADTRVCGSIRQRTAFVAIRY